MTARADLLNLMAEWGLTTGKGSREIADRILNAHAHELATQQRTTMRAPGRSYDASRWNRCVNMTADHIDPAVTEAGPGACEHRDPKRLGARPGDLALVCACGAEVFPSKEQQR